jgi:hypothetical protein
MYAFLVFVVGQSFALWVTFGSDFPSHKTAPPAGVENVKAQKSREK